ncbi:MAG: Calx-beta domain-containing protein [Pseudomonadota bacterium]
MLAAPEIEVLDGAVSIADGSMTAVSIGSTLISSPVSKTFTINNIGNAALTLSNLTLPSGFSISNSFAATVPAGMSTTFTVQLDASSVGTPNGTIQFDTNDSDENPFNFLLTGAVSLPPIPSTLSVTINGMGSVSGSGISCPGTCSNTYPVGNLANLTATPEQGWEFAGWAGSCNSSSNIVDVLMTGDRSCSATFTEIPMPGSVGFSQSEYTVNETDGSVSVAVSREGQGDGVASVGYTLSAGSATAGEDYTEISGTLNWDDGETGSRSINVNLIDDDLLEQDESFNLSLSNPTPNDLEISAGSATVTIVDNEEPQPGSLQFSSQDMTVDEGVGSISLNLSRTDGENGEVSVNYSLSGSATADEDYTSGNGSVTWADGDAGEQIIALNIVDDALAEADETIVISLNGTAGDATLGGQNVVTLTIVDNDVPPPPMEVTPDNAENLNADQLGQIAPDDLSGLDGDTLMMLPPDALQGLDEMQISALQPDALSMLTPEQFDNIPPMALNGLDARQLEALDPMVIDDFSPNTLSSLRPEVFETLTPLTLVMLPPTSLQGLDATQLDALPPSSIRVLTPEQFSNIPPTALGGMDDEQVAALEPVVVNIFTPEMVAGLPDNLFEQAPPQTTGGFMVNLDPMQIVPADVEPLLPADWNIDPMTGEFDVPPGTPVTLKTLEIPANVPDNLELPEVPDLNSCFSLGGECDEPVLKTMNNLLEDLNGNVMFEQNEFGVLNVVGDDQGEPVNMRFTADIDKLLQTGDPEGGVGEVMLTENNQYIIITNEGKEVPLLPAPQDPVELSNSLGSNTQVSLGQLGDVIIRQEEGEPLVVLFSFEVIPAPPGFAPGLHLFSPSQRNNRQALGLVVFSNGTAQEIFPYIPDPDAFAQTALALSPAIKEVKFDLFDGTALVSLDGQATVSLIPQATTVLRQITPGEFVLPSIMLNPDLTLDYRVVDNNEELLTLLVIAP